MSTDPTAGAPGGSARPGGPGADARSARSGGPVANARSSGPCGPVADARSVRPRTPVRDVRLARTALAALAVGTAFTGLPAALVPRSFFDGFPFVSAWVSPLPPFNEHLVTDVGGLFTAFAVLFTWAALRPSRELVVPLCVAWTVSALLHLGFHATHLDGFGAADAVGELVTLGLLVALPGVAVWALPPRGWAPADGARTAPHGPREP